MLEDETNVTKRKLKVKHGFELIVKKKMLYC